MMIKSFTLHVARPSRWTQKSPALAQLREETAKNLNARQSAARLRTSLSPQAADAQAVPPASSVR